MLLSNEQVNIINSLVGKFSEDQLINLRENLESYIHPKLSIFIPIYKYCEFAVSPNHHHPAYSFIYTLTGKGGHFLIKNKKIKFPDSASNFICAFSPCVEHQEVVEEGFSNYFAIFIEKSFFEQELNKYTNDLPVFEGNMYNGNESLLFLLKMFLLEFSSPSANSVLIKESYINILTNKLISLVLGNEKETVSFSNQNKIDKAIAYIYEHICKKITVNELATEVGFSSSHFTKIFKDVTGDAPIEFINKTRIEKAKRLLKLSSLNLTEIAFECGFTSSSYFSHCFIESTKLTPSEYRKKFKD